MDIDTLIAAAFKPLASPSSHQSSVDAAAPAGLSHQDCASRRFQIRSAHSSRQRHSASALIGRMYAGRGYRSTGLPEEAAPHRITLTATEDDNTIGTITVGFDSPAGLCVDELFAAETAALRKAGRRLCEFTKLAMDALVQSKRVLASLFHVAYVCAHRLMDCDDLLVEVNPRHVRFYQRMLGFEVCGPQRMNPRVDAPAVLMRLRLTHAREQIDRHGGIDEAAAAAERSLYPHFFSSDQEASIFGRLRQRHQRHEPSVQPFPLCPRAMQASPAHLHAQFAVA